RIEVRQHIGPLAPQQVPFYIRHRWMCAGGTEPPFTTEAIHKIGQLSGGIPRLINSICDNALLLGFAEGSTTIREEHIVEVSHELRLNGHGRRAVPSPFASNPAPVAAPSERPFVRPIGRNDEPRVSPPTIAAAAAAAAHVEAIRKEPVKLE